LPPVFDCPETLVFKIISVNPFRRNPEKEVLCTNALVARGWSMEKPSTVFVESSRQTAGEGLAGRITKKYQTRKKKLSSKNQK